MRASHQNCTALQELRPATLLKLIEALDGFRRPERVQKFLLACEADARGRTGLEERDYPQNAYLTTAVLKRVIAAGLWAAY